MSRHWRNRAIGAAIWLSLGVSLGSGAAQAANVADTLASDQRFNKIVQLIEQAGLTPALKTASQITVFAPTNDAFNQVPQSMLSDLAPQAGNRDASQESQKLQALIRIHLLADAYGPATFIGQRQTVNDEAGTQLIVDGTKSGEITITTVPKNVGGPNIAGVTTPRTAQVVGPAISADNGVIYPIDNVLIQ